MIVSGSLGILFNPDVVYAIKNSNGTCDIIAANEKYRVLIHRGISEACVENIMARITFQIECQVLKDED